MKEVAQQLGVDSARMLIAWAVKRGTSVVPKSVTKARIKSNFERMFTPPPTWVEKVLIFLFCEMHGV